MIKSLITYVLSFSAALVIIHFSQEFLLSQLKVLLRFKLWDVNLFFATVSLIICIHFKFFSAIKNLQSQLGFIYLPTLFIKGALFFLMFKSSVFQLETLTMAERLNILIPLFMFLLLEVFFIVKIITTTKY